MNAQVKLTPDGHIALPADVRERLDWKPGTMLDLVEAEGSVRISARKANRKTGFPEALKTLRSAARYDGPVLHDADWKAAIDAKFREGSAD